MQQEKRDDLFYMENGWLEKALVAAGLANDKNVFETNREPFATHSICELSIAVALILSFLSATNSTRTCAPCCVC